jgi:hypothetical protein
MRGGYSRMPASPSAGEAGGIQRVAHAPTSFSDPFSAPRRADALVRHLVHAAKIPLELLKRLVVAP